MRRLLWGVPVALFFLNPGLACGPAEPQWEYGAADMRAAVEGNWSFTIMPEGASGPIQVTAKIEQAETAPAASASAGRAFIRAAYACGSRTLVKSAGACVDVSEMPLTVTFVSGDASFANAPMSGKFDVIGMRFEASATQLELDLGPYTIYSQVSPGGTLVMPRVGPSATEGGAANASLTIVTKS